MSRVRQAGESAAALLLSAHLGWLVLNWDSLPARLPRHFGFSGRPDAWTGGSGGIFLLAATSVGIYVLLSLIPRFPSLANVPVGLTDENRERQLKLLGTFQALLKAWLIGTMLWINVATVEVGRGAAEGLGAWFIPLTMAAVLGATAVYLRKSYQLG